MITLINSHAQRHQHVQAEFLEKQVLPFLFEAMSATPYEMSPYVWSYNRTPDNGIIAFMDYPRYTSGYTSLYNTLSFTVETHMFKGYAAKTKVSEVTGHDRLWYDRSETWGKKIPYYRYFKPRIKASVPERILFTLYFRGNRLTLATNGSIAGKRI